MNIFSERTNIKMISPVNTIPRNVIKRSKLACLFGSEICEMPIESWPNKNNLTTISFHDTQDCFRWRKQILLMPGYFLVAFKRGRLVNFNTSPSEEFNVNFSI